MALTDLQKAQNKAASQVLRRAHAERFKQFQKANEAAENDAEILSLRSAADEIDATLNAAYEQRQAKISELLDQIAALQAQVDELHKAKELEPLQTSRRAAYDEWRNALNAKTQAAKAAFPDLDGHALFSMSAWTPPADVLAAMEEARRTATVEILKPKKRAKDPFPM